MFVDPGSIGLFLSMLMRGGQNIVSLTNDVLNNVVSLTGDAHQARVAQDIFRQEIRYERSLQMREDIRDMNKVMLESVSSYLFLGSIILGVCFESLIEGFPPLDSNRMLRAWWLLFAAWAVTFALLGIWFALSFQVKISAASRERLLRRYRYLLADDTVVGRMGGTNLVNTFFGLSSIMPKMIGQAIKEKTEQILPAEWSPVSSAPCRETTKDQPIMIEKAPESSLQVRVQSLDCSADAEDLDPAPLRKNLNAWLHSSGVGYAKPIVLDAPYFLLEETLVRHKWEHFGNKPLMMRVYGSCTLYIAAQCPPLGTLHGAAEDGFNTATMHGVRRAIGAEIPEWPVDERPLVTAGYHPAWTGPSGFGELQRVEGFSLFVSHSDLEVPLYKIVLESESGGYVDVIICWRFKTHCEALTLVLRKGHVHCKEEDWPIAEFNEEIRQITPFQDFSGYYIRRSIVYLCINVSICILSRLWVLGDRQWWWLENVLLVLILGPAVILIYALPIHNNSTRVALSMEVVNQAQPFADLSSTRTNDTKGSVSSAVFMGQTRSPRAFKGPRRQHTSEVLGPKIASPTPDAPWLAELVKERAASSAASPTASSPRAASPRPKEVRTSLRLPRIGSPRTYDAPVMEVVGLEDSPPLVPRGNPAAVNLPQRGFVRGRRSLISPPKFEESSHADCSDDQGVPASQASPNEFGLEPEPRGGSARGLSAASGLSFAGVSMSGSAYGLPQALAECCSGPGRGERQVISAKPSERRPSLRGEAQGAEPQSDSMAGLASMTGLASFSPEVYVQGESISPPAYPPQPSARSPSKDPPPLVFLNDLKYLPPVLPPLTTTKHEWHHHLRRVMIRFLRISCCRTEAEDTPTLEMLRTMTDALDMLFVITAGLIVISPIMNFFQHPVKLGPEVIPGPRLLSVLGAELTASAPFGLAAPVADALIRSFATAVSTPTWTRWQVKWPPFFEPSAVVLDDVRGDVFHAASGSILRTFECTWGHDGRSCVPRGLPLALPEAARGLGVFGGSLVMLGDGGVFQLQRPAARGARDDVHGEGGEDDGLIAMLGALTSAPGTAAPGAPELRHLAVRSGGPLLAAALAELAAGGTTAAGVALAPAGSDDGVVFAALPSSQLNASVESLRILAHVKVAGQPLRNVTGLYIAPLGAGSEGEPVLWVAVHAAEGPRLLAVGLASGRLLTVAELPAAGASDRVLGGGLRGASAASEPSSRAGRGLAALRVAALTGNASHIFVLSLPAGADQVAAEDGAVLFTARLPLTTMASSRGGGAAAGSNAA